MSDLNAVTLELCNSNLITSGLNLFRLHAIHLSHLLSPGTLYVLTFVMHNHLFYPHFRNVFKLEAETLCTERHSDAPIDVIWNFMHSECKVSFILQEYHALTGAF